MRTRTIKHLEVIDSDTTSFTHLIHKKCGAIRPILTSEKKNPFANILICWRCNNNFQSQNFILIKKIK